MLNILIADDNINYARDLMHFINSTSDKIRVSDISINGKETLEILNHQNNIDIVLLDLKMPFLNGIEIIEHLLPELTKKYTSSFIIISGEMELIQQVRLLNTKIVYKVLPKSLDLISIVNNINELANQKFSNNSLLKIRAQISNQLTSIGYSISHNGTQYLIDIIELSYIRGESFAKNLNKYAYPVIAKRYNQSEHNVKVSIIRATEAMYYNCNEQKLLDYFCLSAVSKPTIKTVINTILIKLIKS